MYSDVKDPSRSSCPIDTVSIMQSWNKLNGGFDFILQLLKKTQTTSISKKIVNYSGFCENMML